MRKYLFFILLSSIFSFYQVLAQHAIRWQNAIGGSANDLLKATRQTKDGGYILGGNSLSGISGDKTQINSIWYDYWMVKTDSSGNIQWQRTMWSDGDDILTSIQQTKDGGYMIGGYSDGNLAWMKSENSNGGIDYWIIKTDSIGNIQWQNTVGGDNQDKLNSMMQTNDGGYILGGSSYSGTSGDKIEPQIILNDYWIVKLDSLGNIHWQNTIGSFGHDFLSSIKQCTDGGYILGGSADATISGGDLSENSNGGYDYWIVKVDSVGNIMWQNLIGGSGNDYVSCVEQTNDGGYFIGGYSDSGISGDKTENAVGGRDYWVIKLDSIGNIQWQKTIGGTKNDELYVCRKTFEGGYILGGVSESNISGNKIENSRGGFDYWFIILDSIGNIVWQNTIGGNNYDQLNDIQQTSDHDFLLSGYSNSSISGDKIENSQGIHDYWILKLSPSSLITGKLFADFNNNQTQDTSEPSISDVKIYDTSNGKFRFSQSNGNYTFGVFDTGSYQLQTSVIKYYTPNPINITANFTALQQVDSMNDFAYHPNGVINDLEINLIPLSRFRSGFNGAFNLHYKNIGTTDLIPDIIFNSDTSLSFVSASLPPSIVWSDSVLWNLPTLSPFQEGNIIVIVYADSGMAIGTDVNVSARIEPIPVDTDIQNNFSSSRLHITGALDPNAIIVNIDTIYDVQLLSPPILDYIIYFQNTGNDTAFNIKIENILPVELDENSFEFKSASHPVNIQYNSASRLMTYELNNVNIPDSNVNELLSHGYVCYQIKPLSTLTINDSILNYGSIYFDYNTPVLTNAVLTTIVKPIDVYSTDINGDSIVCLDSNVISGYSTNAHINNNYLWSISGGTIISGQGTDSVSVTWTSSGLNQLLVMECDSNMILCDTDLINVYVISPTSNNNLATICNGDSLFVGGSWQTSTGIYTDSLNSIYGCDSIVITNLSVQPEFNSTSIISICDGDSIFIGGQWQTSSGNYVDSLNSFYGCDSIINTTLNVQPKFNSISNISMCDGDSIFIGGQWQTSSGNYIDSLVSSFGCDSIVNSNLNFNPVYAITDTIFLLIGDSVFLSGQWQTMAGTYHDSFLTQFGCDSSVTTIVIVITSIDILSINNKIVVKPNPANNNISIKLMTSILNNCDIVITNLLGNKVLTNSINVNQENFFDISNFPSGIYLIKIISSGKIFYSKFIKN